MFQTFPNHQSGYGSLQECIPQNCPLDGRTITNRYFEVPHFQQIDITTRTTPISWDITTITLYNHLLVEGGSHQSMFTSNILYIYIYIYIFISTIKKCCPSYKSVWGPNLSRDVLSAFSANFQGLNREHLDNPQ